MAAQSRADFIPLPRRGPSHRPDAPKTKPMGTRIGVRKPENQEQRVTTARFPQLLLVACLGSAQALAQHPTEPTPATAPSPVATMQLLEQGNARFRSGEAAAPKLGAGARRTAARAQNPKAIVLCCSDAAAPPEFVFGQGLGELLVLRTAGHCLDAATVDAIEDAAKNLGATTLVVLGHDDCGAASLAIAQATHPSSVSTSSTLLEHLARMAPSVHRVTERALTAKATLEAVVEDHAAATAAECLRRSPELQRLATIGRFEVRPARYVPATGEVHWLVPHATPIREDDAMKAHEAVPQTMAPHVALRALQAGNRRFVSDGAPLGDRSAARRATAAELQPFAVVLACSDARVVPEHLFDCGIGEIAVIRTPEAALTDAALASVELAVAHGGAPLLVVLGHAKCTSQNSSAAAQAAAAAVTQKSAWLRGLEEQGRFLAIAASYDLESGDVEWLPEAKTAHPAAKAKPRKQTTRTDAHDESHGAAKQHEEHAKADSHGHENAHGENAKAPAATGHDEHAAHPAPAAETQHAEHGHEQPAHGEPSHAADTHGTAHGDAAAHDSHAAQDSHQQPTSHDAHDAHGEAHGDAKASHGDAAGHGEATGHGDAAGHNDATPHSDNPSHAQHSGTSPVLMLGIAAIASLTIALLIALRSRR